MMRELIFYNPGKVIIGLGVIKRFITDCNEKGIERLFIFTIEPLKAKLNGFSQALEASGIHCYFDYSITKEPVFQDLDSLLTKIQKYGPQGIVGIGGGSVMDTAKLLSVLYKSDQTWDEVIGMGMVKRRNVWLVCIPTTSGTGSEVSPNAIFLDLRDGGKKGVISPFLVPDAAYVDPELTIELPPIVTASTGIDALTHCIEAYMNKFAHPMTDLLALEGIKLIASSLPIACIDGLNIEARSNVALGSLYGGMCLGPVNTAAVHALAYPLGSMFGMAHGLANALMLPYVMAFNVAMAPARFADVAMALGVEKTGDDVAIADKGIIFLRRFLQRCGIEGGLSSFDIPEDSIPEMAVEALKVQRLLNNNLREVTLGDAINIYKRAFDGL
ncbi:iron-containing alcohol dehydrogenase [Geofilum sp. OHC36d9]|uniref:iron-containing alcohol dehydrogenase n=1 Tax=Geofilum sp. OHC36d9 TaxID=3458413 RepID=UPI004034AB79